MSWSEKNVIMAFLAFLRKVISGLKLHLHKILQLNWAKKKKSETSLEMLLSLPGAETVHSAPGAVPVSCSYRRDRILLTYQCYIITELLSRWLLKQETSQIVQNLLHLNLKLNPLKESLANCGFHSSGLQYQNLISAAITSSWKQIWIISGCCMDPCQKKPLQTFLFGDCQHFFSVVLICCNETLLNDSIAPIHLKTGRL